MIRSMQRIEERWQRGTEPGWFVVGLAKGGSSSVQETLGDGLALAEPAAMASVARLAASAFVRPFTERTLDNARWGPGRSGNTREEVGQHPGKAPTLPREG